VGVERGRIGDRRKYGRHKHKCRTYTDIDRDMDRDRLMKSVEDTDVAEMLKRSQTFRRQTERKHSLNIKIQR